MQKPKILVEQYVKNASINKDIAYKFLENIISIIVEPFGLLYEDGSLIFYYEPSGTAKIYKKIISTDINEILVFLDIKVPKENNLNMIRAEDLFDSILASNKFTPDVYSPQLLLQDVSTTATYERRLRYFFYGYIKNKKEELSKTKEFFLYPIEDILVIEVLNYNFPDKKIKRFVSTIELKHSSAGTLTYLGPSTIMTWIPELRDRPVQEINNIANAFKNHIRILYKKDYDSYIENVTDKDLRDEFIQFYVDTKE